MITPNTPLEDLEAFFAAQSGPRGSGAQFAIVTDGGASCRADWPSLRSSTDSVDDAARKFVLGIVTVDDLKK